jgi:hypothetical protein
MVEKVERYKAKDGREFIHKESALRHEAVEAVISAIPELALIRTRLEASMNEICVACEPLARFLSKTTLEVQPETTLDPCCVNTPRGQDHHTDCPEHPEHQTVDHEGLVVSVFAPSSKPRWDVDHDLADRLAGRA